MYASAYKLLGMEGRYAVATMISPLRSVSLWRFTGNQRQKPQKSAAWPKIAGVIGHTLDAPSASTHQFVYVVQRPCRNCKGRFSREPRFTGLKALGPGRAVSVWSPTKVY